VTSEAVQDGIGSVIKVAALISISVGIMNLLPIPPLDGGQMVVAFAEMLRGGRRLSMKVQGTVSTVGLGLVMLLIVSAFAADFQRFVGAKKPPPKIVSQDKPDKPAK
jgi:regulator of sigma E protease